MTQTTLRPPQAAIINLDIEFDGTPKSLAQIATILDKIHVKIITSFTHRSLKGNKTRWGIVADTRTSPIGPRELQTTLLQLPEIQTVTIGPHLPERVICKAPPFYEPIITIPNAP
jgi:hypothetical protein